MWTIVLFLTSLSALLGMIFFRAWEIKKGRVNVASDGAEKIFDASELKQEIQGIYALLPQHLFSRAVTYIVERTVSVSRQFISFVKKIILAYAHRIIKYVKGRQRIEMRNQSSAFIKDILAHKERIRSTQEQEKEKFS